MERILVSACLLGRPVRYDGAAKPVADDLFARWRSEGRLVPFCPEVSGGLTVPRPAAEIVPAAGGGAAVLAGTARVLTASGDDVTEAFVNGARLALDCARRAGARIALLKEGSPSCGVHRIHDGTFQGRSLPGEGITAALLAQAGLRVFTESELPSLASFLDSPAP
ncbi:hypothetical protein BTM25_48470 [Actinomadura rubteroloni]|uniref:Uncharacterized protein n=1 Tax=Actinomadura rubteroloni TaxID=1926885 RepID=A0A2P4UC74_9ACTN|nr:DUF523 domain-containing protein [Actinomadura rubteroloni]POM22644.1 hypothetical protein BTM25_48470 [Actinomadura rubteroloni]